MFRFSNSDDDETIPEDTFRDALIARFGESAVDSAEEPPADAPEDSSGGEEGSSPLPSSPPESDAADEASDGGGFEDTPEELPATAPEVDDAAPFSDAGTSDSGDIAPTTPDGASDSGDGLDLNELFERYYGEKPTAGQMTALLGFVDQVNRLTPQQQQALNAVLSGQPLAPTSAPTTSPEIQNRQPASSNISSDIPNLDQFTPEAKAAFEAVLARQEALEAEIRQQQELAAQSNLAQQQTFIEHGIQEASTDFVKEYRSVLSDTDLVLLETQVQRSGQFPYFMQQHGGDAKRAYRALLDTVAFSDPSIRQRIVAASTTPAQAAKDQSRKQKAAAVSAGGVAGSKMSPLTPSASTVPTDPTAAQDWAINEIARMTGLPRIS